MTKNELKAALTLANIPFKAKATLETLQLLHHEMLRNAEAESHPILEPDTGAEGPSQVEEFTSDEQQVGFTPPVVEEDSDDSFEAMLRTFDPTVDGAECPHCEIDLTNGLLHVDDEVANGGGATYRDQQDPAFEAGAYTCMGCGGHFGEPVVYTPAPVPGTGLKIEKDREERNGIKRPSIGGKCRAVWDAMDDLAGAQGSPPTAKQVKALAEEKGWNPNNASIEYYQWRKFNGITGRAPKAQ